MAQYPSEPYGRSNPAASTGVLSGALGIAGRPSPSPYGTAHGAAAGPYPPAAPADPYNPYPAAANPYPAPAPAAHPGHWTGPSAAVVAPPVQHRPEPKDAVVAKPQSFHISHAPAPAPSPAAGGAAASGDAAAAAQEHKRVAGLFTPLDNIGFVCAVSEGMGWTCCNSCRGCGAAASGETTIKGQFGTGTLVYFRYAQFLLGLNVVLSALAAMEYATVASIGSGLDPLGIYAGVSEYFTAAFPAEARPAWYAFGVVQVILALAAGPCFGWLSWQYQKRWRGDDRVDELESSGEEPLPENADVTERSRNIRKTVSIIVFLGIIVGQAFLMLWLHRLLQQQGDSIAALIISLVIPSLNIVWKIASKKLTALEAHRTMRVATEWDTAKVFLIKVANLLTLYGVKAAVAEEAGTAAIEASCPLSGSPIDCSCPLSAIGYQFFWLLISDLSVGFVMELGIPAITLFGKRCWSAHKGRTEAELRPDFELSEEFVQLLYRQLIIYLGSSTLPFAPILGLAATVLSFWLDKYRLVRICRKPEIKQQPLRPVVLMACHVVVAIAALASYPNGLAFLFAGFNIENVCSFWA